MPEVAHDHLRLQMKTLWPSEVVKLARDYTVSE